MADNFLCIYVIYRNPRDYPNNYVVRCQRVFPGKIKIDPEPIIVTKRLMDARKCVPKDKTKVALSKNEDPCIFEVYI